MGEDDESHEDKITKNSVEKKEGEIEVGKNESSSIELASPDDQIEKARINELSVNSPVNWRSDTSSSFEEIGPRSAMRPESEVDHSNARDTPTERTPRHKTSFGLVLQITCLHCQVIQKIIQGLLKHLQVLKQVLLMKSANLRLN